MLIIYEPDYYILKNVYLYFKKKFPKEKIKVHKLSTDPEYINEINFTNGFKPSFVSDRSDPLKDSVSEEPRLIYMIVKNNIRGEYLTDFINNITNAKVFRISPTSLTFKSIKRACQESTPVKKRSVSAYRFSKVINYIVRKSTDSFLSKKFKMSNKLGLLECTLLCKLVEHDRIIKEIPQSKKMYIAIHLENGMILKSPYYSNKKDAEKAFSKIKKTTKVVVKKHKINKPSPKLPTILDLLFDSRLKKLEPMYIFNTLHSLCLLGYLRHTNDNRLITLKGEKPLSFRDDFNMMKVYDVLKLKYYASIGNSAELLGISLNYGPCVGRVDVVKKEGWMKYEPLVQPFKKKLKVIKVTKEVCYTEAYRFTERTFLKEVTSNTFFDLSTCMKVLNLIRNQEYINIYEGKIYPSNISKFICFSLKQCLPDLYNSQLYIRTKTLLNDIEKKGKAKKVPFSDIYNSFFGKTPLDSYDIRIGSNAVYIENEIADIINEKIVKAKLYTCYRECPMCKKYKKCETRVVNGTYPQTVVCLKCGNKFNY